MNGSSPLCRLLSCGARIHLAPSPSPPTDTPTRVRGCPTVRVYANYASVAQHADQGCPYILSYIRTVRPSPSLNVPIMGGIFGLRFLDSNRERLSFRVRSTRFHAIYWRGIYVFMRRALKVRRKQFQLAEILTFSRLELLFAISIILGSLLFLHLSVRLTVC